jgi:hypothetical protein
MTIDDRDELMDVLAAIPDQIREAALAAQSAPVPEGEWPLPIVVCHLAHVEGEVWRARLRQMAAEANPRWQNWEAAPGWDTAFAAYSLDQALELFAARRRETLAHLGALTPEAWNHTGLHARYGMLDVEGVCRRILLHDEEHLQQLKQRAET